MQIVSIQISEEDEIPTLRTLKYSPFPFSFVAKTYEQLRRHMKLDMMTDMKETCILIFVAALGPGV
jgi:hypothetical protein